MPRQEVFIKKLSVRSDPKKGRGVYAEEKIKKGDLIEVCHLIITDVDDVTGKLEQYIFEVSKNKVAVALGNGSLFNHSNDPNAYAVLDAKNQKLEIKALKKIRKNEEVLIDYGYSKTDKKKYGIK